jgi:hypothetical protein
VVLFVALFDDKSIESVRITLRLSDTDENDVEVDRKGAERFQLFWVCNKEGRGAEELEDWPKGGADPGVPSVEPGLFIPSFLAAERGSIATVVGADETEW